MNPDGTITFTPGANTGPFSLTYEVTDNNGGPASQATVSVEVLAAPNADPVAVDDAVVVAEDGSVTFQPGDNDTDANGDPVAASDILVGPQNGTATVVNGEVVYTPDADFFSEDTFTVEVTDGLGGFDQSVTTVTVTPENDDPVANDDNATTSTETPVIINVLANDIDVDGDGDGDDLTIDTFGQGSKGTVTDNGNGTLTYTPNAGAEGEDAFTYTVTDGTTTDTATVTVEITSFPEPVYQASAPMNFGGGQADVLELPHADIYETPEGTVSFAFTAADTNGTQGLFTKDASGFVGGGNHFALYLDGDTLKARFQDGTTSATLEFDGIVPGTEYKVAAVFSPAGAELWIDGNLVDTDALVMDWTTNAEWIQWGGLGWGSATGEAGFGSPFAGTISDKAVFDVALNSDQVAELHTDGPVNMDPVAVDDVLIIDEDTSGNVDVIANDTDIDSTTLAVESIASGPANGSAVIETDGTVTYTPFADFFGNDSFELVIEDGDGGFDTSVVNVTVNGVEDDPVANDDAATTSVDQAITIDVLANDEEADNEALSIVGITNATNGSAVVNGNGTITFTPEAGYNGPAGFTYEVSDGDGPTDTADVTVDVVAGPFLPDAVFEQDGVSSYNGSGGAVENYAPNNALEIDEGTIAFSFIDGNPSARQGLVVKDASGFAGGGNRFAAYIDNGDLIFRFQDGANSSTFNFDIDAGTEYEVAAVFSGDGVEVWVDGVKEYEDDGFIMDWTTNQEYLQVGGLGWVSATGASSFTNAFSGEIADVQIFDEALDGDQIGLLNAASSFDDAIV